MLDESRFYKALKENRAPINAKNSVFITYSFYRFTIQPNRKFKDANEKSNNDNPAASGTLTYPRIPC